MKQFVFLLVISAFSNLAFADLGKDLCQQESAGDTEANKFCQGYLIASIDAAYTLDEFCPDGNTSYNHIIETWRRQLRLKPYLVSAPTFISMKQALIELKLFCKPWDANK